ncbi:MAG: UDP-N-acetylmuramoyl-tripeptide--D-alanyl-D-alanine ligase [Oscillospiraceae bacterium]|nr:UDP-N-acetylmuramoyl-tripeptide--D-alanyl-D-alanine ligase [Oscillospiraceae bacterium]
MNMKPMTLAQAAEAMGGTLLGGGADVLIRQVVMDSRKDVDGALFVAIPGARADGHNFVADVLRRGAVCALVEREIDAPGGPCILVDSTLRAVRDLAAYYRGLFDIPVIGITGSVGKTSTKEMLGAVLSAKFCVHKTAGNLNNELGVPMTLFGLRAEHQAAVIEMGISDFGEMTRLTDMVRPDIAIITIIGYAHLDNLGDRAGVFRAKTEIFHGLPSRTGLALLNGDDDMLRPCKITDISPEKTGVEKQLYGLSKDGNGYWAEHIENRGEDGTACTLCWGDTRLDVGIPAFGTPLVYAALAAAAVGDRLGMTPAEISRGISSFQNAAGRAIVCKTERLTIIDDCYNANPSSVKASLTSLAGLSGRRVAILGDMKELGPDEAALHFTIGQHAALSGVDALIAIGPLSEAIYKGWMDAHPQRTAHYFLTKEEALTALPDMVRAGDQVLVKASRSMRFEEIVELLQAFEHTL